MNTTEETLFNVAAYLETSARDYPFRPAVIYPEGRDKNGKVSYTHYTFEQLLSETRRIAKALEKYGIKKGTKTVLMVKPSLEFFALTFALFQAGVVPVLVDPGLGIKNLKVCIAEVKPEAFIGIEKAHIARVLFGWGKDSITKLVTVGKKLFWGGITLEELKNTVTDWDDYQMVKSEAEDIAAIVFTSGSTGVPKGVIYNHRNFYAQIQSFKNTYNMKAGEIDLPTFPLFALFNPALGMTAIIPDMDFTKPASVDPLKIIEAIENFGVTHMFGSPALINKVSRYGAEHKVKFKSLKRVLSAGAPVPYETLARFKQMLPDDGEIHTPYGATECLPITTISGAEIINETKDITAQGKGVCIGRVMYGLDIKIIKITDDPIPEWNDNLVLPNFEVGEIVVKGDNATRSYYNREESTKLAKIYEPNNEFRHRMGDLGYYDDKGRVWFCGRKTHRVVTNKSTFFTITCEAIYNTHPDVYRSALVGVKINNEMTPLICIELEANSKNKDKEQIKKELLDIANKFDHTKEIKHILFHDSFPVDIRHNSKIFREKLAVWSESQLK